MQGLNYNTEIFNEKNWQQTSAGFKIDFENSSAFSLINNSLRNIKSNNLSINSFYIFHLSEGTFCISNTSKFGSSEANLVNNRNLGCPSTIILTNFITPNLIVNVPVIKEMINSNTNMLVINNSNVNSSNLGFYSENYTFSFKFPNENNIQSPIEVINQLNSISRDILTVVNPYSTLFVLNNSALSLKDIQTIIKNTNNFELIDFWDLPADYPHNIIDLYNFNNQYNDKIDSEIITEPISLIQGNSNNYDFLNESLMNYQFKLALDSLFFILTLIFFAIVNLAIIYSIENVFNRPFHNYFRNGLIRGGSFRNLMNPILKMFLFNYSIILSISVLIFFLFFTQNFVSTLPLFLLSIFILLIFDFIIRFQEMINWFNSNNSLVKDYSKLKTKFSLVQITTVLIVFSLFTLLFFFFFQNSIKTNSFIEPIFFFIFIITFIYSIAVKNSLVANFNMVITKISNTFNIKTGRILNNNKIILRSMLQKWYFLLFLLIVINPLIYANLVEINHFSNQYPYMYKISDRYYEGVTENQSKLLDNAPNVVNSTIIELIYYFGTFSLGNKNLKQFFTIYVLNFKKIAQLLPKKTLNYLDPSLKKLLVNGLDNGPYGIFSNPLSSNLQLKGGSILNLESNLNITYDRTFSYFPGILTSNWIILDKTNKFFNLKLKIKKLT